MVTPIYTSKKLEKFTKKLMNIDEPGEEELSELGKWNANIFYVQRKKCWLLTNAKTRYSVILTDVTSADIKNIDAIFKDTLYSQLIYDGIFTDYKTMENLLGDLRFFPTDNDRRTIGFQNVHFGALEYRKYEYPSLADWPVRQYNGNLNNYPFHWGKVRMDETTDPVTEMKSILES